MTQLSLYGLPQTAIESADLGALYRAAYQRGDVLVAELAARVVDAEQDAYEEREQLEEEAETAGASRDRLLENIGDAAQQLQDAIDEAPEGRVTKAALSDFVKKLEAIAAYLEAAKAKEEGS